MIRKSSELFTMKYNFILHINNTFQFQQEILNLHGRDSWAVKLPDPLAVNDSGKSLYEQARDELNTWVRQDG